MTSFRTQKQSGQRQTKSKMFFTPDFRLDLDWKDTHHLRVGSVLPINALQISKSLKDMSSESIRNRFLGSKKEFTQKELDYLTQLDGFNHYAIGIEERDRPQRGVAIVRLVRSSEEPHQAEIAISIIDDYQKMGLGGFLLNLITLAAFERGITKLSFTYLPQNDGIVRLISKMGVLIPGPHTLDYTQMFLVIGPEDAERIKANLVFKKTGINFTFNRP